MRRLLPLFLAASCLLFSDVLAQQAGAATGALTRPVPGPYVCSGVAGCLAGLALSVALGIFGGTLWQWVNVEAQQGQPVVRSQSEQSVLLSSWWGDWPEADPSRFQDIYLGEAPFSGDPTIGFVQRWLQDDWESWRLGHFFEVGGDYGNGYNIYASPNPLVYVISQHCNLPCTSPDYSYFEQERDRMLSRPSIADYEVRRLPGGQYWDSFRWREIIQSGDDEYNIVAVGAGFEELFTENDLPSSLRFAADFREETIYHPSGSQTRRLLFDSYYVYVDVPFEYHVYTRPYSHDGRAVPEWCALPHMSIEAYSRMLFRISVRWTDSGGPAFESAHLVRYYPSGFHVKMSWPVGAQIKTWHGFLRIDGRDIPNLLRVYSHIFDQAWAATCFGSVPVPVAFPEGGLAPWDEVGAPDFGMASRARDGKPVLWLVDPLSALYQLFVPSRSLVERYQSLSQHLQGKFPFSLAAALRLPPLSEASMPALPCTSVGFGRQLCADNRILEVAAAGSRFGALFILVLALTLWLRSKLMPRMQI